MKWQAIELSLQPGTIYTTIPSRILNRLGIRPYMNDKFLMPDGRRIFRQKGIAKFRYQKNIGSHDVIFGLLDDPTVIGELALASIELDLDRKTGELKPLRMILA